MNLLKNISGVVILSALTGGLLNSPAAEQRAGSPTKSTKLKPYVLKSCPVSDEKLGEMGEPYVHAYKDREIKLCCQGCLKDFNKDTAKYLQKIEAAEAKAAGLKPYSLKTCLVSGDRLGEMGEPYVHKYQNHELKFCCKGCLKDFEKNPASFMKKLEEAEKTANNRP